MVPLAKPIRLLRLLRSVHIRLSIGAVKYCTGARYGHTFLGEASATPASLRFNVRISSKRLVYVAHDRGSPIDEYGNNSTSRASRISRKRLKTKVDRDCRARRESGSPFGY
jgi:hypothetical protein